MDHEQAKDIVEEIVKDLCDRSGGDGWWGSIDEDIQEEIKTAMIEIILGNCP